MREDEEAFEPNLKGSLNVIASTALAHAQTPESCYHRLSQRELA